MSNTTEECIGGILPIYEGTGLVPILITLLLITVLILFIHLKVFCDQVDSSHPVFAVIQQDLIVLSLCGLVNLLLIAYVACTYSEKVFVLSLMVGRVAMQFHSVAWLVVTILR